MSLIETQKITLVQNMYGEKKGSAFKVDYIEFEILDITNNSLIPELLYKVTMTEAHYRNSNFEIKEFTNWLFRNIKIEKASKNNLKKNLVQHVREFLKSNFKQNVSQNNHENLLKVLKNASDVSL